MSYADPARQREYNRTYYHRRKQAALDATPLLGKHDAPCCASRVERYGDWERWPVGYCSPECERRDHTRYAR